MTERSSFVFVAKSLVEHKTFEGPLSGPKGEKGCCCDPVPFRERKLPALARIGSMQTSNILKFLAHTQHLKAVLRHSWTDDISRQESVAEHSWHMALMAIALAPELKQPVDLRRVFELIAVHDLGEIITGDIPAFAARDGKYEAEKEAVEKITQTLPTERQKAILALWQEYEDRKTKEALFVKMLDVIDVINQHLVADLSTWSKEELTFNLNRNSEKFFKDEPAMLALYDAVHDGLEKKVAGGDQ